MFEKKVTFQRNSDAAPAAVRDKFEEETAKCGERLVADMVAKLSDREDGSERRGLTECSRKDGLQW